MLLFSNLALLALVWVATAQDISLETVKKTFESNFVTGNLSLAFDPKVLLEVTFPQPGGDSITLQAGATLVRNSTAGPPSYRVLGPSGPGPFVIASVDLDAPTPQNPNVSQIRHFLGGNFKLDKRTDPFLLKNTTAAISQFRQPTPPAGSDAHRYVFLVFNQTPAFDSQTLVTSNTSVAMFNISSFAAATGLGQPIGGTFMFVAPQAAATVRPSTNAARSKYSNVFRK